MLSGNILGCPETLQIFQKISSLSENFPNGPGVTRKKISGRAKTSRMATLKIPNWSTLGALKQGARGHMNIMDVR